ncbi:potassium transporter TrkA [Segetibacter aerophilus]|uniref:Potassium transporter TrkA n=2 Tax=Segetibacter aerophilus TaxID=670293 RepID=A0A512B9J6_9BACT|nr:potassium transporter TrkA [Segetibacter aerophilus]
MYIENYSFLDALYMTIITISTIGYNEVHHLSNAGRIFNILLIGSSLTTTAFAITMLTRYVVDGEINLYFKHRRMNTAINSLENHVILCGYGRNGKQAAATLCQHKVQFVVIEINVDRIEEDILHGKKLLYVKGNATEDETLIRAGIKRAKALITALPADADNVFIVLTARTANSKIQIISRASHASSAPKLRKAGADNVILPDKIGGMHMATLVTKPDVIEFIDYLSSADGESIHLEAVGYEVLPTDLKDKSLHEIMAWRKTGVNCLGVKSAEGKFVINPPEATAITVGMKVIILGTKEQIQAMKGNVEASRTITKTN